ncbi:MAG: hypothetical protein K8S23_13965 [Candidatus Cloacimonetes bacterium]|nr:hypothetical protein [Candidatus Cloacimonadota bacterium]
MLDKIFKGIVSLSMVLFSSYQGNEAKFTYLNSTLFNDHIVITSELENAFDNDFNSIFKSGQKIEICFDLKIHNSKKLLHEKKFCHSVEYDPLYSSFFVVLEESDKTIKINSYPKLIKTISNIEYEYVGEIPSQVKVSLKAYLKKLNLKTLGKEYNLMLLWKLKNPEISQVFNKKTF